MTVNWTPLALRDLENIHDYHADFSRPAAQRLVRDIEEQVAQLVTFPMMGRPLSVETLELGRKLVVGRYIVLYRVSKRKNTITVIGVADSKQQNTPLE